MRDIDPIVVAILICLLAIPVLIVVAAFTWQMSISWTYEVETIQAYTDMGCTIPWDHTLNLVGVSTPQTFDFYIQNEGNVAVDVTITNEVLSGATVAWTPTSLSSLTVGTSGQMTLTITFTADGSYDFDFESNKSP